MAIYDEGYSGLRYTYGCRSRPPMIAAVPNGRIVGADNPEHPSFAFGTISYPAPLSQKDIDGYELTPLRADGALIFRVTCAVLGDATPESKTVERWQQRWREIGATIIAVEDAEDSGADCQLLLAIPDRRAVFTKAQVQFARDTWYSAALLYDADQAEGWRKDGSRSAGL